MQRGQLATREYYLAILAIDEHMQTMSIDERKVTTEPTKVLEDVPLDQSNPEKFTRIGTSIEMKMKQDLVHFLKKSMDVVRTYVIVRNICHYFM